MGTQRLIVRGLRCDDRSSYLEVFGDPAIASFDDYELVEEADVDEVVRAAIARNALGGDECELAVVLATDPDDAIGFMTLRPAGTSPDEESVSVGYHFSRRVHGRGLATEALAGLLTWWRSVSSARVYAYIDPENLPSRRVLERLAFIAEGERVLHGKRELVFAAPDRNSVSEAALARDQSVTVAEANSKRARAKPRRGSSQAP